MEIITTHNNVDFDALASVVAANLFFPEAVPVLPKQINPNVKAFLSIHKDLFEFKTAKDIELDNISHLVVVDANRWGRINGFEKLRKKEGLNITLWDHHPLEGNIPATEVVQETIGANITLLIRRLKEEGQELTPVLATLFLAAIYEDTGNLTFPSSTAEDAFAAGYLLQNKADLELINTFLRPAYGEKQKDLLFEMLQNSDRGKLNDFSVSFNVIKVKGHMDRLSLVVHMYREILNVDAAFGIFHNITQDRCMVIGRSNIDGIHVGSIMRSMGGGGHPGAGSAVLKGAHPEAVTEWIRELIVGNQQSSVHIGDLMSYPVISCESTVPMRDFGLILDEHGCTGVPVVEDGLLIGVVSRRDFNKVRKQAQLDAPVRAFMSTEVVSAAPEHSPMQAARLMVKHDIGRLPIVEDGRLIGIITRSDVMSYFYDLLPD